MYRYRIRAEGIEFDHDEELSERCLSKKRDDLELLSTAHRPVHSVPMRRDFLHAAGRRLGGHFQAPNHHFDFGDARVQISDLAREAAQFLRNDFALAALGHPKGVDSSAPWFAKPLEPASSSTGTPRRGKHRHARAGPDEFQVTAPLSSQGHVGVLVSPASSRGLAEARASPKPANRDMLVEPVRPQPKEGRLDGRVPISGWRRRKACRPNRRRSRLQYRTGMPETRSTWVRGRFAWSANETTTQTSRPCWSWKKADPLS